MKGDYMARKARIKYEFGSFHILQFGGDCRKLFIDDKDREKFMDILLSAQGKFNFILHGYCLINDNSYDLILDVNGGDLSKIMKSINIAYAMYAKCEGKLFSDRYKSTFLENEEMIAAAKVCVRREEDNPYSNVDYRINYEALTLDSLYELDLQDCHHCMNCITTAHDKLQEIATSKGLTIETLLSDKAIRNQLILKFRKSSTLSLKTLGQLFGGLSESSISKIIKNTIQ
jgi:hypothetical protein